MRFFKDRNLSSEKYNLVIFNNKNINIDNFFIKIEREVIFAS